MTEWEWDGSDAGGMNFGFLRFDDIIGDNPGQVPPDATIIEAILTLHVTNEGDASQMATMHTLVTPFDDTKDFLEFGDMSGGEPLPDQDYVAAEIASIPGPAEGDVLEIDVTDYVKEVASGGDNYGWVFIPGGSNGVGIASSEAASNQPMLTVYIEGTSPPEGVREISQEIFEANESLDVSIALVLQEGSQDVTVVETIPGGWTASNISDGGSFADGSITWNLSGFSGSTQLSYTATAPASPSGDGNFSGAINEIGLIIGDNLVNFIPEEPVGEFDAHEDIGDVGAEGSATFEDGEYQVRGSGADIWGSADEFHYAYKRIDGAFRIKSTVEGFNDDGSNDWSKIGLMVRQNNSAGSPYYFSMIRGSDFQYATQWRTAQGVGAEGSALEPVTPMELEIIRVGDTFQASYLDPDSSEWVLHDSRSIEMSDPVLLGLAVTSHDDGLFAIGFFNDLEIELYSFETVRSIPAENFLSGKTLTGITLTAKIREGESPDLTITETPPAGWTPINIQSSSGQTEVVDGNIVWTLTGASGAPTLTYDLQIPDDAIVGTWSGSGTDGGRDLPISGANELDAIPPLYKTGNVLAVGVWNDDSGSSDLAVTAELSDNNGVIYAQDSSAEGGWPSGTIFRWKTVFFDDGFGEEEPGWQLRSFTDDTEDNLWIEETDLGFTIGHGGNDAENGEILLDPSEETVYTRSIFDAQDYENITELTLRMAGDDEAVAWLNGVFLGFTASGTSDRGETARDYVYDTTISGGSGGLENGSNPTDFSGGGVLEITFPVNLVESENVSVSDWSLY